MPASAELQIQIAAVNRATSELRKVSGDLRALGASATASGAAVAKSGSTVQGAFAGIAKTAAGVAAGIATFQGLKTGLQETIGAAIAFESSFAGIRKTVDATEAEFQAIAKANRTMAKELPASANEINRIGELAGQLGIKGAQNIVKFERTIVDLSETTDLSAEAAATSFAQIANVVELPIEQIDRLGSAIVDLGNKGASTESEIVDFTQRIAGAGKIAGLTVAEIAGIGSAFASTGVEAEAGGTAIQKVLIEMTKAAATGGKELETFAQTAGLSVKAFQDLAKSDPSEAFTLFVEGLQSAGDQAFDILEKLGLADQRLIRSFLSVAQAGDLLRTSIETGTTAFAENTALTTEAEKRYATNAAQLEILRNNVQDVGISLGQVLLPALAQGSQAGVDLLDALRPLGHLLPTLAEAAVAFGVAFAAIKAIQFGSGIAVQVQQLVALQAALAQGMTGMQVASATLGRLATAFATPTGAALGLGAAFIALDLGMRKFTGSGVIETLTGSAKAAEEAARKTEFLNDQMERLNELVAQLGDQTGPERFIREQITQFDELVRKLEEAESQLQDIDTLFEGTDAIDPATKGIEDFTASIKQFIDTAPDAGKASRDMLAELRELRDSGDISTRTFDELNALLREEEAAAYLAAAGNRALADDLLEMDAANQRAANGLSDTKRELAATVTEFDDLGDAVKAASGAFDTFDPLTEVLKAQRNALEQERLSMQGLGQDTAAVDDKIAALTSAIEAQEGKLENAQQAVVVYAAGLRTAGFTAEDVKTRIAGLSDRLNDLPEEQQIELKTFLNDADLQTVFAVLAALERGVEVPVAIKLGGRIAPTFDQEPSFRKIKEQEALTELTGIDVIALDDVVGAFDDISNEAEEVTRSFSGAGSAAGGAASEVDILSDGLISMGEAATAGLSPAEAALMELGRASNEAAEAAFREQVELNKVAIAFAGLTSEQVELQLGLKALADELKRSGRSVTEFLRDLAQDAADALTDAFGGLFRQPTREGADIQKRIAEQELERAKKDAAGASEDELEAIDDHIESLRKQKRVLDAGADLQQASFTAAQQTLLTEEERAFAAALYTIAIQQQTTQLDQLSAQANLEALARDNLINAIHNAADAYNTQAGLDPNLERFNSLSPEDRYNLAKLLESLAGQGALAGGTSSWRGGWAMVGEQGPELVNLPRGARVYTASETQRMSEGGGGFSNYGTVNIALPNVREPQDFARELDRQMRGY